MPDGCPECERLTALLAVKSDDIVRRVEAIAAHRCGDCARQKAFALEAAEKYAAAHNAMKQAVVIQSEQAAEIRRLRAILTAPAPLSGNAGPCAAR
jgi:predicted metal-binding protein